MTPTDQPPAAAAARGPVPDNEAHYRLLFDANPHPMWVWDQETLAFMAVNEAAVRRYGYARAEFLRMTIKDIRPPEDVPALLEEVSRPAPLLDKAGCWRHRTKDGSLLDVEITSHALEFAGRPARLVLAQDVTERRRAERELRDQRELLRGIIDHLPCAVFWKDRAGRYLGCNAMTAVNLGMASPDATLGKTDAELVLDRAEADFYMKCDRDVMDGGRPLLNIEETQRRPDGRRAVLLTSKAPLRDADGRVVGLIGVYTDITERKRLEEKVRQSQKMETVGRLAGGIAHDFNNLLTIINGYSELLLSQLPPGDRCRAQVEQIQKAGDRAASLTRQLLAFSRQQMLAPRVLDVNVVVADVEKMLERLIGEDVELTVRLDPAVGPVRADPGQLEQVLLNLAVNGRDAMPHGGKLTVATAPVGVADGAADAPAGLPPGAYVLVTVSDTGCGMDAATREHLFEPFFTTKEVGKGTGLGLATVYGIVQQFGGRIDVDSEPGRGTTFRIYLPRHEAAAPEAPADARPLPRGSEVVLLVEDEDMVRSLAGGVLRECGYTVLEARHGAEALQVAERHVGPLQLLVTDVIMPQMGGRELADRLRHRRPDLKVLYISGYTDDTVVRYGVLEATAAFLQKPFTRAALAHKVRAVLDAAAP